MNTPTLGRLEKVERRTTWTSEWNDFTPWLAKPENLKLLGDTVGIDLEFEAQEIAPRWIGSMRSQMKSSHSSVLKSSCGE